MCDCINRIEKEALQKMKDQSKSMEIIEEPEFDNKSWLYEHNIITTYNNIVGKYKFGKATRKFEMRFLPTFCPFCGEKLIKEKNKK